MGLVMFGCMLHAITFLMSVSRLVEMDYPIISGHLIVKVALMHLLLIDVCLIFANLFVCQKFENGMYHCSKCRIFSDTKSSQLVKGKQKTMYVSLPF